MLSAEAGSRQQRRDDLSRGFTLLELLIALSIATVIIALVVPVVRKSHSTAEWGQAVLRITSLLERSRVEAIDSGYIVSITAEGPHTLIINRSVPDNDIDKYSSPSAAYLGQLAPVVDQALPSQIITFDSVFKLDWEKAVFYPNGSASSSQISLTMPEHNHSASILVDHRRGLVQVEDQR